MSGPAAERARSRRRRAAAAARITAPSGPAIAAAPRDAAYPDIPASSPRWGLNVRSQQQVRATT